MEEYIKTLSEQIRHKKARATVEEEIRQHIEDQAENYEATGIERKEAVKRAVRDMGDPIEAGIALDCVHRPQMAWGMVAVIAIVSICSILLQIVIGSNSTELGWNHAMKHALHVGVGFAVMLLVYRLDYTFIGQFAKYIAILFLGYVFINIHFSGLEMNGARAWAYIPGIGAISLRALIYLFIPVYAGLLYEYRGKGVQGLMKSIAWMLLAIWICLQIPATSQACLMFFMMAVLLSLAVWKEWFGIKRIPFLIGFWSCLLVLPAVWIVFAVRYGWLKLYQIARLQAMFAPTARTENFMAARIREYIGNSLLVGNSGNPFEGYVYSYESEHVMAFVASYYGIAIAVLAFTVVLCLGLRMMGISLKQKNQLGMLMGCGCGLVFLALTVVHIMVNFGLLSVQTWLPFFSSGGTGIFVTYVLLGIVLSVYRYKEILPVHVKGLKIPKISIIIER